jgi:ABC-type Fe3+-siderophore transport system permease subunit
MFKFTNTSKKLLFSLLALSVVALVIGCVLIATGHFFTSSIPYYIVGIAVGFLFDAIKVIMMTNAIEKAVDMTPKDAANYVRLQYSSRFFLTLVVLVAAYKVPFVDPVGVIIELLLLQPASYITNLIISKDEKRENLNGDL